MQTALTIVGAIVALLVWVIATSRNPVRWAMLAVGVLAAMILPPFLSQPELSLATYPLGLLGLMVTTGFAAADR